jgi:hypothetical protein
MTRDAPDPGLAPALADLDRLARNHPDLAEPAHTLARALAAAFGAKRPATPARIPPDAPGRIAQIEQAWTNQIPAFQTLTVAFDPADVARRFRQVCDALFPSNLKTRSHVRDVEGGRVDPVAHLHAWLRQDPIPPPASPVFDAALALIALPALAPARYELEALGAVPPFPYTGGLCPFCGEIARLAEARGIEQHRLLRCARCAAAWHTPRLACPFCQSSSSRDLDVHYLESQPERARLLTCRACDGRLKIITTLAPLSPPALLVADLATIHLDLAEGALRL